VCGNIGVVSEGENIGVASVLVRATVWCLCGRTEVLRLCVKKKRSGV
jgi:hypothetical protein